MWVVFKLLILVFACVQYGHTQKPYSSIEAEPIQTLKCKTIEFLDASSECTAAGAYPVLGSCTKYIQCYRRYGRRKLDSMEIECGTGQAFDLEQAKCLDTGSWDVETEGCEQTQCQSILKANAARANRQYYGNRGYNGNRFPGTVAPPPPPIAFPPPLPDCPPEEVEEEPEFGHNPYYASKTKVENLNCRPVSGPRASIPPPPPPPPPPTPRWPQFSNSKSFGSQERATLQYNDPRYRNPTTTEPPVFWPTNPPYNRPWVTTPRPSPTVNYQEPEIKPVTRRPYVPNQEPPFKPASQRPVVTNQEPEYKPVTTTQRPYLPNQEQPFKPTSQRPFVTNQEPEYKPAIPQRPFVTNQEPAPQRPYVNNNNPPAKKPDTDRFPPKDWSTSTESYEPVTEKVTQGPAHDQHPSTTEPGATSTNPPDEETDEDYDERQAVNAEQAAKAGTLISNGHMMLAIIAFIFCIA